MRRANDPEFIAYRQYIAEIERYTENEDAMRAIAREPMLKIAFFRTFGYRGEVEFTLMPEVWLRDLPLLVIGRDAHLGYGMILGTGQVSQDGSGVRLRPIAIGARSFCNQHAVIEGGTVIGDDCLVGIGSSIGEACRISDRAQIGDCARLGHEVAIGERTVIGHNARIGNGSVIDPDLRVGDGARIPPQHRLTSAGLFPLLAGRLAA
ncbi:hypothetical protein LNKW23_06510 [Paralimibaculum aggregatum]|uniref:Transferase n=2 Tax=Paralimibaculum aggregatum TaxID=3036245 RepID=A0ABQ6LDK0_9RHOB|nr:hypothetical protein LNKW23_06510 [Limibaculum sp. NKW23]